MPYQPLKVRLYCLAGLFVLATGSLAQAQFGQVVFNCNFATRVTNALTGMRVPAGDTYRVGLYAAPAGVTNESVFIKVADTNFISPGQFVGGYREVPPFPVGATASFQVRVWEWAYGTSYEAAIAAGNINGRPSHLGKSRVFEVPGLGDNVTLPVPGLLGAGRLDAIIVTGLPDPAFSVNNILVAEGSNGTAQATFTVKLFPPLDVATSIDFLTVDGSATAGNDYVATNDTLSFSPGQSNATVAITLNPDLPVEADEDFFLRLTNAVNAAIVPGQGQGRCIITEVHTVGSSTDVAITFNTVVGHRYVVEKSDDFLSWSSVAGAENVIGTGSSATAYDRGGGCQPSRIYRARLVE
jgi:hypothetical protein